MRCLSRFFAHCLTHVGFAECINVFRLDTGKPVVLPRSEITTTVQLVTPPDELGGFIVYKVRLILVNCILPYSSVQPPNRILTRPTNTLKPAMVQVGGATTRAHDLAMVEYLLSN